MAKFSASCYLLFVLIMFALVKTMVPKVKACQLATIGGGCPNLNECVEVCRPCYRGVGQIVASCRAAGGGIPYDQCICSFKHGAPCSPPGPPRCPGKWLPDGITLNGTLA